MSKDEDVFNAVINNVDKLKDDAIGLLQNLIRIPSVNPAYPGVNYDDVVGGERKCNEYLAQYFYKIGLEPDLWEEEKERTNLAVKFRGGGKTILLCGHIDTVPTWDPQAWPDKDPFSGNIKNDKVYGRGAVDDKGPIVSAAIALKAISMEGIKLKGDAVFCSVVGEETMQHQIGITSALKRGYIANSAVVLEATNPPAPLAICPAQAEWVWMKVHVKGKSTHTSVRYEMIRAGGKGDEIGVGATEKAVKVINGLLELEREWGFTKNHPLYPPGFATIAPCSIEAGPSPFVIPDYCTINYSIFYPPNIAYEQIVKEIEDYVSALSKTDGWLKKNPPKIEIVTYWPGFLYHEDEEIVKTFVDAYRQTVSNEPKIAGFLAVTDGAFIQKYGIPTIIFGPGNLLLAHSTNEFINISELLTASKILALGILKYCGWEI